MKSPLSVQRDAVWTLSCLCHSISLFLKMHHGFAPSRPVLSVNNNIPARAKLNSNVKNLETNGSNWWPHFMKKIMVKFLFLNFDTNHVDFFVKLQTHGSYSIPLISSRMKDFMKQKFLFHVTKKKKFLFQFWKGIN